MPLLMFLALPVCAYVSGVRSYRRAKRRGGPQAALPLGVHVWAAGQAFAPIVLVLSILAYIVGVVLSLDGPSPPQHPW